MFYDELIKACIDAINGYNPDIETPDSFVERFLKKVNKIKVLQLTKDPNEKTFIQQVYFGVLRYRDFLKAFTEFLFTSKPASTERKDDTLFQVILFLTIFRINEIPVDDYKAIILVSYIFMFYYYSYNIVSRQCKN